MSKHSSTVFLGKSSSVSSVINFLQHFSSKSSLFHVVLSIQLCPSPLQILTLSIERRRDQEDLNGMSRYIRDCRLDREPLLQGRLRHLIVEITVKAALIFLLMIVCSLRCCAIRDERFPGTVDVNSVIAVVLEPSKPDLKCRWFRINIS